MRGTQGGEAADILEEMSESPRLVENTRKAITELKLKGLDAVQSKNIDEIWRIAQAIDPEHAELIGFAVAAATICIFFISDEKNLIKPEPTETFFTLYGM